MVIFRLLLAADLHWIILFPACIHIYLLFFDAEYSWSHARKMKIYIGIKHVCLFNNSPQSKHLCGESVWRFTFPTKTWFFAKKKKTAYISLQRYVAPTEMNVNNKCNPCFWASFKHTTILSLATVILMYGIDWQEPKQRSPTFTSESSNEDCTVGNDCTRQDDNYFSKYPFVANNQIFFV